MLRFKSLITTFSPVFLSTLLLFFCNIVPGYATHLDILSNYVQQADPSFQYRLVKTVKTKKYTLHMISMDSQRWRTSGQVNRTLWTHWLSIVIPKKVVTDTAMLIVNGGNNRSEPPELTDDKILPSVFVAQATGSVVMMLGQVPNQPLQFNDAAEPLREDGLVAFSWKKAMDSKDFTWPAYLPMVKSVVRAMDASQAFISKNSSHKVNRFVVAGFSKRAAATWLTATVDNRVIAIAPGVYDVLNFEQSMKHHFFSYGFYSEAIEDYVNTGIIERLNTPEGRILQKIVDPYHYLHKLKLPLFLINSPGDEFFPADSARFYFNDLSNDRLLRYIPNTDHSLEEEDNGINGAVSSLAAWYQTFINKTRRPTIRWKQQNTKLLVTTDLTPIAVNLWQTTNTEARDFRMETTGRSWKSIPLAFRSDGQYLVEVKPPNKGWTAYFVEFQYANSGFTQTYTTRVFITPDKYIE